MGKLLVAAMLLLTGFWALGASSSGAGARSFAQGQTPAQALAEYESHLAAQQRRAEEAERRRRYNAGEMSAAERAEYEAELEAQRRAEAAERARAAAYARSVRGTRVSGGGPSSGK